MAKEKPLHFWNHRVITKLFPNGERAFSIVEVHYRKGEDGKDIVEGYGKKDLLSDLDSVKGLHWTLNKAKLALKKPILDEDNWPNEWNEPNETALKILQNGKFGKF